MTPPSTELLGDKRPWKFSSFIGLLAAVLSGEHLIRGTVELSGRTRPTLLESRLPPRTGLLPGSAKRFDSVFDLTGRDSPPPPLPMDLLQAAGCLELKSSTESRFTGVGIRDRGLGSAPFKRTNDSLLECAGRQRYMPAVSKGVGSRLCTFAGVGIFDFRR